MKNPAPRLALFMPDLTGGGAERVTVNLADGFCRRGFNVDLVVIKADGPYLAQIPPEIRLVELGSRRARYSIPALAHYLRRERPAALISALHHANIVALLAKKLSGTSTPLVVTIHSTLSEADRTATSTRDRIKRFLMRTCFPWADRIVAVSDGVAEDFAASTGLDRKSITTVYNPVISDELLERSKEGVEHPWFAEGQPPVILAIGRLTEAKDFATLIRAFSIIRQYQTVRLMILGEGEQRGSLEALLEQFGLHEDVSMPGFVDNPYAYLRKASLFVLSSKWEGLPTVLIEALAVGVPVVATDCKSGPREILGGGQHGRLVPVGDSAALAEAIRQSLCHSGQRVGEDVYRPFTYEAATEAYLRLVGIG